MRAGVPAGVVNSVPAALSQSHVRHRELLVERGSYVGVRSPARLYGTPAVPGEAPAAFGQHSVRVLQELGYDDADIARLQHSGVVPAERRRSSKP
jgi:crotonobetainyl-CoA:carnitine CoA-transferase CaiB-like acyl-CoA transferase